MKRLNIFATKDEIEYIKSRFNQPVMLVGNVDISRPTPQEAANECAIKHGLSEIDGYYGIDLKNGEFITT